LKLECDEPLPSSAFKFNLRHYTKARAAGAAEGRAAVGEGAGMVGRGLHSFPFQINLSSSVHRITQINSLMCPGVAQLEL